MIIQTILWQGLFLPGHETCRLSSLVSGWQLEGTAVFAHDRQPCRLDYRVVTDSHWQTLAGRIQGWLGNTALDVQLASDAAHHWSLDGVPCPELTGCIDLDLNFSPCTNLLPLRRLDLAVGATAHLQAAWLRFPSFKFEVLAQQYTRLDESTYRYESAGGRFVADLKVDPVGFVTDYPSAWQLVAAIPG